MLRRIIYSVDFAVRISQYIIYEKIFWKNNNFLLVLFDILKFHWNDSKSLTQLFFNLEFRIENWNTNGKIYRNSILSAKYIMAQNYFVL